MPIQIKAPNSMPISSPRLLSAVSPSTAADQVHAACETGFQAQAIEQAMGCSAPCLARCHSEIVIDGQRYALVPVLSPSQTCAVGQPEAPLVRNSKPDAVRSALTAREVQIVRLVASGLVNKQIAGTLQISEWTVSTYLRRIFSKLRVDTRAAMVSRYVEIMGRLDGDHEASGVDDSEDASELRSPSRNAMLACGDR